MQQSKMQSLAEAGVNVVIGWTTNLIANFAVLPWFGFDITMAQNLIIGTIYTVISLARSYTIRRYFETRIENAATYIAGAAGGREAGSGP